MFFCHFFMLCCTISQFNRKLKSLFSNVIIFIYDSPLCDKVSAFAHTVDCCFASGKRSQGVLHICSFVKQISNLLSFFLHPSLSLLFTLPLYFCNLERCRDLSWMFLCIYIYIYDEFMCLEYWCHVVLIHWFSVDVLTLFIRADWCTL